MHGFLLAAAVLPALAILWIGYRYLADPLAMAPSFGLPLPESGPNIPWWLRLKGVRDVASGVVLLAVIALDGHRTLGVVLLLLALIPLGDMTTVLAAHGRRGTALRVHGATAAFMILVALPLLFTTAGQ